MNQPSTGTLTFLFTDIEGSTQLWEQHPDAMKLALAQHDAILRQTMEAHGGYVFKTVGDSFYTVFTNAPDALSAALDTQHALGRGMDGPVILRVRMGLHSGPAEQRDNDYFGATLNRVARLMAAGHGGQTLLSAATKELLENQLPEGVDLRDMGEHSLKDLTRPEHIYQLTAPGLQTDFQPLKTLEVFRTNLPAQLTSFIGRKRELIEMQEKLNTARLLTLIGPGGTGKTRLSLQIAANQSVLFQDGIWFVELAPIGDPTFIVSTIAAVLDIREAQGVSLINLLIDYLRAKEILLVLDNCEHLIEATAQVAEQLLQACPKLKIITSSREALGIDGETIYRVPSLSVPNPSLPDLMDGEATRLFIERATKAEPRFQATAANAAAIVQICQRLDGIPLAIELAAARIKLFTPEQIAERLDDRFKLLTGGSRTALPRQQTLRALIDWSYHSLNEIEQRSLRRLAVFSGGWTIEGAESVIGEDEALEGLIGLVNKSLVNVTEQAGAAHYRFLETIRQYAMEKLLDSGESTGARDRHLEYMLQLAGEASPAARNPERLVWLEQMEVEHDNLRAALEWSTTNHLAQAIELAFALRDFWMLRDYNGEAVSWCETILAASEALPSLAVTRIKLYGVLSQAAIFSGNARLSYSAATTGLSLTGPGTDPRMRTNFYVLISLSSMYLGDLSAAQQAQQNGEKLAREWGYTGELGMLLMFKAQIIFFTSGDMAQIKACVAETSSLTISNGSHWSASMFRFGIARLSGLLGDVEKTRVQLAQAANAAQKIGNMRIVYSCASELAHTLRHHGGMDEALIIYRDVLPKWRELGHRSAVAHELECIAIILTQKDQPNSAVTLLGAAQALRQLIDSMMTPPELAEYDQVLSALHSIVDENKFNRLWQTGQMMTMDEAIRHALIDETHV